MSRSGVLVVCLPAVGDFVRCLTAVRLVAERHPGEPIDALGAPPGSLSGRFAPDLRHVYELARRSGRLDLGRRTEIAREIGKAKHRTAYVLASNWKAALVPFLAGIPERIGWFGEFRYPLINRPRFGLDRNDPPLLKDHAALFTGRWDVEPRSLPPPRLHVDAAAKAAARAAAGAGAAPVIAMVTGGDRRAWSIEKSIDFARRCRASGYDLWLIGAARDRPATEAITAAVPGVVDMTHSTLEESIVRIAAADVFVGSDTGLTHVAAALGGPVVALYAAWLANHSGPINPQVRYLIDHEADHRTMFGPASLTERIGVDAVFDAVEAELAGLRAPDRAGPPAASELPRAP